MTGTYTHRFKTLLLKLNMNVRQFSKAIGYTNNVMTIGNIINHDRKPSFNTLERIKRHLPQVNTEYLLDGIGEPILDGDFSELFPILNNESETSPEYIPKEVYDKMVENYERTISILQEYVDVLKNK